MSMGECSAMGTDRTLEKAFVSTIHQALETNSRKLTSPLICCRRLRTEPVDKKFGTECVSRGPAVRCSGGAEQHPLQRSEAVAVCGGGVRRSGARVRPPWHLPLSRRPWHYSLPRHPRECSSDEIFRLVLLSTSSASPPSPWFLRRHRMGVNPG